MPTERIAEVLPPGVEPPGYNHDETLARIDRISKLMDSEFRVPGTGARFGLDTIVGFIPGLGDAMTGAVALYLINEARKVGAPNALLARMLANAAIDTAVGAIPVAGDVFDVVFKSNRINARLLKRHLEKNRGITTRVSLS